MAIVMGPTPPGTGEMAAADMARRDLTQCRRFDLAARLGMAATWVEVAA